MPLFPVRHELHIKSIKKQVEMYMTIIVLIKIGVMVYDHESH